MQELRKSSPEVPVDLDQQVEHANAALDKILLVVPEEDLDKGREVVEVLKGAANVLESQQGAEGQATHPPSAEAADAAKRLQGLL
jgi:hypothetical protein